ncbi:2Fe-2S iron-sulfur cluster-binding protein [Sphingobacterium sp.]|jgi:2Fe-2S ferredoxin|uniref:2Fe-2S iron-sulfur cluster-binding protein n=1 Tax=Sphingobacterium sp. TaxID=341027 RepID=UPI002896AE65|nr:2Fe-2S iron-sulfur cluster-binding protein [Sphingobacterium sp.]
MEENLIQVSVIDRDGKEDKITVPTDINLSLMEILKASDYEILATCGGMALCATCHVEVVDGLDSLPEASDQELDMLDTLPDSTHRSRLACQLHLQNSNNDMKIKIKGSLQ